MEKRDSSGCDWVKNTHQNKAIKKIEQTNPLKQMDLFVVIYTCIPFWISSQISSICSKPIDNLISPSEIPTSWRCYGVNLECVVDAGCVAILRVSPKFAVKENNLRLFKKRRPDSKPPSTSKVTIPPQYLICLTAISYCG